MNTNWLVPTACSSKALTGKFTKPNAKLSIISEIRNSAKKTTVLPNSALFFTQPLPKLQQNYSKMTGKNEKVIPRLKL
jgi:hypothetical protein